MTVLEWTPEQEVDAGRAAELIAAQFPALRGLPVVPFATGWDNTVHLVGGEWVFRFPHRAVALPLLARETAVLPRLAGRLPLPVPDPELVGEPSARFLWPFWGARLVPGRELAEAGLPEDRRTPAAAAVGSFLRALHDPALTASVVSGLTHHPAALAGVPGLSADPAAAVLPVDPMGRADPGRRSPLTRQRLGRLAERGVWQPDPAVFRLLDDAEPLGPSTTPPVLVHGDLHQRHLLLDDAGRASGVIDWGDVCLADPAVDLSLAYGGFSGPARAALLDAYGPVPPDRAVRARVLALSLSAALAEYAHDEGRAPLLRESLAGLSRAVA